MEEIDLTSEKYWTEPGIDVRLNPKRNFGETDRLARALLSDSEINSAVVLATSGSQGEAKFPVLKKEALLVSARTVNEHCGLNEHDVWLCCLPTFHVGGLGIYARAYVSGAKVVPFAWDAWDKSGSHFVSACNRARATLTSLTPVHLFDLVEAEVKCPDFLRGVLVGWRISF